MSIEFWYGTISAQGIRRGSADEGSTGAKRSPKEPGPDRNVMARYQRHYISIGVRHQKFISTILLFL